MLDLIIHMQLRFLHEFLVRLEKDIALEWAEIEKRNEEGEFRNYEDYEAAIDFPLFREEFAARSIFNELNILAEEVLHTVAQLPWQYDPASRSTNGIPMPVWELPIKKTCDLIENHYDICLKDLLGWEVYNELREINNAFKHRKGFRRFSDIFQSGNINFDKSRHKATIEEAKKYLESIGGFLLSIARVTTKGLS